MIKGMALGGRGNKVSLLLGLTLGVVAAILSAVYLSGARNDGGAGVSAPMVPVVVAAENVPAGTRLTAEMLLLRSVPETAVLVGAHDSVDNLVNQVTVVPIVAGEQVIADKVAATGDQAAIVYGDNPPLAYLVEEGFRGVSVEVSPLIGSGGLIRPGDYVDVILTVRVEAPGPDGQPAGKNQVGRVVVQNVKVLAIDQNVANRTESTTGVTELGEEHSPEATTVTLAATPVQAEILATADMCRVNFDGRLALTLRGLGDEGRMGNRADWPSDGPPPDCASLLGVNYLP
jgi:pilus assembly protein CpaB